MEAASTRLDVVERVCSDGSAGLLSSHIIADLEGVCDYLIILAASRVQLAGDIAALVGKHRARREA